MIDHQRVRHRRRARRSDRIVLELEVRERRVEIERVREKGGAVRRDAIVVQREARERGGVAGRARGGARVRAQGVGEHRAAGVANVIVLQVETRQARIDLERADTRMRIEGEERGSMQESREY